MSGDGPENTTCVFVLKAEGNYGVVVEALGDTGGKGFFI